MISRRKILYPLSSSLRHYLYHFGRQSEIPLVYDDLYGFTGSVPYINPMGEETLWLTVMYPPEIMEALIPKLTSIYATLKIGGDLSLADHLTVDRIDFGSFGNSRPFRVCIRNLFNGNSDYYYVKTADASRLYGLELEHLLSPNRLNYLVNGNTLIEEHIAGVPGDVFLRDYLKSRDLNKVRIAKEFTKFNERCFIRLLGDMRSVNYVVDITPDFEEIQYRVRPIDFDQQCYEGRSKTYLAYHFDSNKPITRLAFRALNRKTIAQYVEEERAQMARRAKVERIRLRSLLAVMQKDSIAPDSHVETLRKDLAAYYPGEDLSHCQSMGELTARHLEIMLR
ncbi:hypothetical protein JIN78_13835 [Roseibacillus ishigakijimensis]|uniref:Uncharacterized protein n=2 Tax=Roseibacillus ishigakijimensis TaxID=454146 RepID=A0A934VNK9_9BACT|nr:hypothetical protein [Roseibacillus ishigakijimensis]